MIQFEKVTGRWRGWGFLRQPDYGFADCERSVTPYRRAGHPGSTAGFSRDGLRRGTLGPEAAPCASHALSTRIRFYPQLGRYQL